MRRSIPRRGFTLVEVLVALAILGVAFLSIMQIMYRTQVANSQSAYLQSASSLMAYIARELSDGQGEVASAVRSGTGGNTCDAFLAGSTARAAQVPSDMVAKAFQGLQQASDYNQPSMYSATVQTTPIIRTVAGVPYKRAIYVISVFYPSPGNGKNCLSTRIEAGQR